MARYALVIGISEYSDSLLPNLTKTASDAKAIAALLRESNTFQKVTVLPSPVNQQAFVQALKKFLEEADKNEALIYYTGHGITQVIEDSFGRTTKQGHLVMSDSRVTLNPQKECIAISSSIPLPEFNQVIQDSNLSNLVVLLDCCHSQYVLERGLLERLTAFSANTDYYFVAACRTTEASRAKKSEQHSVFTGALLAALAAENADEDGVVTGDRVFDCLYRGLRGLGQEPIRMGWGRSIPIVIYPEKRLEPATRFNPTNPYVGLAAFEASQQDYFFGREQAIGVLLDRMTVARFLAVTGSSGCGKSSLVKAGLLPQLAIDHPIATMTPGTDPLETWQKLLQQHQTPERPLVLLIDQFEELFTLCQDAEKQQAFIQHLVAEATQADRTTQVLLTIRNDFLDRCAKFPEVAALINSKAPPKLYLVPELSLAELQAAIVKPALRHGVTFTEGLAADIAAEVMDQRGSLPLLQYALTKLWDACISENSPDRLLTREAYEQIGGVNGALRDTANLLYETSSSTEQPLIRKLMLELVRVNDDQSRTRRRVSRDRLEKVVAPADQLQAILDKLTRNRLIVLDERAIEVTHEALLTEWTLLDSWIKAEQEQIYLRDQVEACYKDWQERYQRSPDALLSGALLAAVEEKLDWQHLPETEFVRQSIEKRQREVRFYRTSAIGAFIALACITMISTVGAMLWRSADRNQIEAFSTSAISEFNLNRNTFDGLLEALKAGKALQNSFWFRNDPELRTKVMTALAANTYWVREKNRLEGHSNYVQSVAISPDKNLEEQIIATASFDNTVRLWDRHGKLLNEIEGSSAFTDVSFSQDSKVLATVSLDGTFQLWNRDGTHRIAFRRQSTKALRSVSFSPTEMIVATAGEEGVVYTWNAQGKLLYKWAAHNSRISNVTFSPDGKILATAGRDGTTNFWDLKGQRLNPTLRGDGKAVLRVKFSPNPQIVAIAREDGSAILWNWRTRTAKAILKSHTKGVTDVIFSNAGSRIITASMDGTIKLWDSNGQLLETLEGHLNRINQLAFDQNNHILISVGNDKAVRVWQLHYPYLKILNHHNSVKSLNISLDEQYIASVDTDNIVYLWNLTSNLKHPYNAWQEDTIVSEISFSPDSKTLALAREDGRISLKDLDGNLLHSFKRDTNEVLGVSFSRSNSLLASVGFNKLVSLWKPTGQLVNSWQAHNAIIYRVKFSPDNTIIATSADDGTVNFWNQNGKPKGTLIGHKAAIYNLSFSPDNQVIATASADSTAKLWSLNGNLLNTLIGHSEGVTGVDFIPRDGRIIATSSDDRTVKLWQRNSTLIVTLLGHTSYINWLQFSPDSKTLATAGGDKRVILWKIDDLTLDSLMNRGCQWSKNYRQNYKDLTNLCNN